MGVISRENEITLKSLPPKIFKALFVDWDTLILKVRPSLVQKVRIVDGNGEAGTVKVLDFGEG